MNPASPYPYPFLQACFASLIFKVPFGFLMISYTHLTSLFPGEGEGRGQEAARRQGEGDGGAVRAVRKAPVLQHQGPRQGDEAAGDPPQGQPFLFIFQLFVYF